MTKVVPTSVQQAGGASRLLSTFSQLDLSQIGHLTNFVREINQGGGFAAATQFIATVSASATELTQVVQQLNQELDKAHQMLKTVVSEVNEIGNLGFGFSNDEHLRTSEQGQDLPSETADVVED